jgi:hypothetical protein
LSGTRQDKAASWLPEELAFEDANEVPEENLAELIARARAEVLRGEVSPLESIL